MNKIVVPDNVSKHDNVFDVLKERGFIEQCTHEEEIKDLLTKEKIKFYIGFDPTADCLHIGHFMQIMTISYMMKFGHTPIVLLGGGTGMVGDPSGRTDMRKFMDVKTVEDNCNAFKKLFEKYIEFDDGFEYYGGEYGKKNGFNREPLPGKAISLNNAKWLMNVNYINFIRDIGRHFTVNNMLRAECYKQRLADGLTFLEINYLLMQSYDFMVMARDLDVKMQFGGNDQWSNLIGGVDLTRKELSKSVYAMTFTLLTNSEGKKMGKTQAGALWLDAERTSCYEFFQYWRNVADADVEKCLKLLTFLPIEEIEKLVNVDGSEINKAKEILAYEITKIVHGEEEAKKALDGSRAAFSGAGDMANIPHTKLGKEKFEGLGLGVVTLLKEAGLVNTNSEGFRLIEQGGLSINGEKVVDKKLSVTLDLFDDGKLLIQKGKKVFHMIEI
ncbi:MAG: tyrosine--tRNA ligase [Eubacteriales bacterium]|nr:tyrosine--tRNA ligase [Eubacteriales bacterium]MDY3332329.1 tyrosine--tRNA ligase [Gallibacter sp.]